MTSLKIGIVQMRVSNDIDDNLIRIQKYAHIAAAKKIELICFPECALTGYVFKGKKIEQAKIIESIASLKSLSTSLSMAMLVGAATYDKDKLYNSALIIIPGRPVRRYAKINLTDYDKQHFSSGRLLKKFKIKGVDCGVLICRDQDDPLLVKRLGNITVLFYLSSHHYGPLSVISDKFLCDKLRKNKAIPVTRAVENKIYVAKSDAVGIQNGYKSIGASMIVDPDGIVLRESKINREALLECNFYA